MTRPVASLARVRQPRWWAALAVASVAVVVLLSGAVLLGMGIGGVL